jgi:NADPH-dependent curcumin reductase CurA
MLKGRVSHEIHLKERPIGVPTESNFALVKISIPDPKDGEFLVRNLWMSVDPYMRGRMREMKSYLPPFQLDKPLEGAAVGQVIESKNKQFKVGDYILSNFGWREYWLSNDGNGISKIDPSMIPIQSYLGIMGLPGLSAYVGLLKFGEIKENVGGEGHTLFVSAAAGAVGSIACQIGKIKGYQVVGSTGTEEKVTWLLEKAGIDNAFNYKELGKDNITSQLKKICPTGIDIYLDNVGGSHLEAAIDNMKTFGIVILCGMISQYNNTTLPTGPANLMLAITKRLKIQGFIVRDHYHMLNEFHKNMAKWIDDGKIKWKETLFEGLEKAPKAFISLFEGQNIGKMLVKIEP